MSSHNELLAHFAHTILPHKSKSLLKKLTKKCKLTVIQDVKQKNMELALRHYHLSNVPPNYTHPLYSRPLGPNQNVGDNSYVEEYSRHLVI